MLTRLSAISTRWGDWLETSGVQCQRRKGDTRRSLGSNLGMWKVHRLPLRTKVPDIIWPQTSNPTSQHQTTRQPTSTRTTILIVTSKIRLHSWTRAREKPLWSGYYQEHQWAVWIVSSGPRPCLSAIDRVLPTRLAKKRFSQTRCRTIIIGSLKNSSPSAADYWMYRFYHTVHECLHLLLEWLVFLSVRIQTLLCSWEWGQRIKAQQIISKFFP